MQIPTRRAQLLETYGPKGFGLVPPPQPAAPAMEIRNASSQYVEIGNPNSFAVDVSNWVIGGDTYFKFPPGEGLSYIMYIIFFLLEKDINEYLGAPCVCRDVYRSVQI